MPGTRITAQQRALDELQCFSDLHGQQANTPNDLAMLPQSCATVFTHRPPEPKAALQLGDLQAALPGIRMSTLLQRFHSGTITAAPGIAASHFMALVLADSKITSRERQDLQVHHGITVEDALIQDGLAFSLRHRIDLLFQPERTPRAVYTAMADWLRGGAGPWSLQGKSYDRAALRSFFHDRVNYAAVHRLVDVRIDEQGRPAHIGIRNADGSYVKASVRVLAAMLAQRAQ